MNGYLRETTNSAPSIACMPVKAGLLCFIWLLWCSNVFGTGRLAGTTAVDTLVDLPLPKPPMASMELVQVPDGFVLELFASEPEIGKPIAMDWDERGRLWIIETVAYPNSIKNQPGDGDDRILICEDTDGDGKADNFTVFADGLKIPTSFVFTHGGVLVAQAPYFLFLKDLDGDDVADTKEVVMTGWGVFDTHAGPSNLQYGLDNKLWGTVGYAGFDGYIAGDRTVLKQGVFRFDADVDGGVDGFEYLAGMSNNTWGLGFSEDFDVFVSCTNNEHSVFLGIPNRYFERVGVAGRGTGPIDSHYEIHPVVDQLHQLDVKGGFTAATGHNLYTARSFPEDYWGNTAFICEPTGRLIHKHVIVPHGSGFRELGDGGNMLASSDSWFSPVAAKVGPDGALWLLDWYNLMVQHTPEGQDAAQNPGRDLFRGRVYRLVYKKGQATAKPKLDIDDAMSMIAALQSDNLFWRTTAQRLIVQRRMVDLADALCALVQTNTVDAIQMNGPALHAVWTLSGLGLLDGSHPKTLATVLGALKHAAPGVRKAAIQALPVHIPDVAHALLTSGVLDDPDGRVRLAAYLALMDAETNPEINEAISAATRESRNTDDRWIAQALKLLEAVHNQPPLGASRLAAVGEDALREKLLTREVDQVVALRPRLGQLRYDKQFFEVKAGSTIRIEFSNPNYTQHNVVIVRPGALDRVRDAAEELARGREGAEQQYIPATDDVLFATPLVNPDDSCELLFTAPTEPGSYPFLCTFPGHSETMHGTMEVVK
ncbi:PVC-type heme-binding CxxCH protein [Parapedobacter soli]|uniref:PVC-type heme-binding CxxCH protein n=1 Tax=Parapedobacter soli TaxID=416955 RepID=UPI0021CAADEB|nr:PVC-type heme-binding CxxCH protein [Parapedobacter soli]